MENNALFTKYKKITYQDRVRLIDKVCNKNIDCINAAKEMQLSISTAKMIVKKFKEEGKIFERKDERLKRNILEKFKKNQQNPIPQQSATVQESAPVFFYIFYPEIQQLMCPQFPIYNSQYYWLR